MNKKTIYKITMTFLSFVGGVFAGALFFLLYNNYQYSQPNNDSQIENKVENITDYRKIEEEEEKKKENSINEGIENDLEIIFQEITEKVYPTEHPAPRDQERYYQRLDTICRNYQKLCNAVSLKGNFSSEDSFFYKAIAIFIVARIDKHHPQKSLEDVITIMNITDKGGRRGSATREKVTINTSDINTYKEYLGIVIHELGHVIDLGLIQGNAKQKHTRYTEFGKKVFSIDDPSILYYQISREAETIRKAGMNKYDFCSGYGQSNPFEDFSECLNLYMSHNSLFRALAEKNTILKKKYNTIAQHFGGKYLYESRADLALLPKQGKFYTFDTTKIGN